MTNDYQDYPHAVRVSGQAVVIVSQPVVKCRHHLTPHQAEQYAARIVQAARQARWGVVPTQGSPCAT